MLRRTRLGRRSVNVSPSVEPIDASEPAEVFVKLGKQGTTVSGLMHALAVTISAALQHGVPWPALRDKHLDARFEPSTNEYTSLVDAVAKNIDQLVEEMRRNARSTTGGNPPTGALH